MRQSIRSALLVAVIGLAAPLSTAQGQPLPPPEGATPPAAGASLISRPIWRQRPTADDLRQVYPLRARREKVDGRAMIRCTAKANGRLERCEVLSEDPLDYGFGAAALKLGSLFVMEKTTRDGAPVTGAVVMIPIVFRTHH